MTGAPARAVPAEDGCHVLHVEVDAPAVQVALARRPQLTGLPVLVGAGGMVHDASPEARAFGVGRGDDLGAALARCPHAVVVPVDPVAVAAVRDGLLAVLEEVTALVEPVGTTAAAYVDVGGARRRLGPPTRIAWTVRDRLRERYGVGSSVGIGATKVVARLAGRSARPDGVLLVPRAATARFLRAHPVAALAEVDGPLEAALAAQGIRGLAQLADASPASLRGLGRPATARWLQDLAWGRDPRPVVPTPRAPAEPVVRAAVACADAAGRRAALEEHVREAARACGRALDARRQAGRTVVLTVRTSDGAELTRSRTLDTPSGSARELYLVARALLAGVAWDAVPVSLAVSVCGLTDVPSTVRAPRAGEADEAVPSVRVPPTGARGALGPAAWRVSPAPVARPAQRSTTTIVIADIS
ncbi:DNA polymerase Y family protein [Cellulomonas shaoxiangyii]|uniref:DNA polymerase IV n=1 Tax=Cellulomonas shaoxiangyii TaxID=2566013 RepID=A0A4P7SJB1_9CELL|nr:DNA polymerase IV [Cellulomonas shaoxiangyii]QCB93901.1 DNA polymerase IV [Cellulomonas shaoxiangyii]TGY85974.1 DNA polymerase IV [Cellulomonas shaoxiangyii]